MRNSLLLLGGLISHTIRICTWGSERKDDFGVGVFPLLVPSVVVYGLVWNETSEELWQKFLSLWKDFKSKVSMSGSATNMGI